MTTKLRKYAVITASVLVAAIFATYMIMTLTQNKNIATGVPVIVKNTSINDIKVTQIIGETSKPTTSIVENTKYTNLNIDIGNSSNRNNTSEPSKPSKPNTTNNGNTSSNPKTQKPPSTDVTVTPNGTQSKDSEPNPTNPADQNDSNSWTPPPPGVGTGDLISSGFDNIPINTDKSVEALQREVGLCVGSDLLNAGYKTLYPNAGAPQSMVEDAVKNYANTNTVTLNPTNYGLPKVVGYYNIKLTAKGINVTEASDYIFEYMKNDKTFNDEVKSTFNVYKDGWLSVYQKDGYFYILFTVIDKGYSSFG